MLKVNLKMFFFEIKSYVQFFLNSFWKRTIGFKNELSLHARRLKCDEVNEKDVEAAGCMPALWRRTTINSDQKEHKVHRFVIYFIM